VLSVIIPARNEEKTIYAVVRAAIRQADEVIVIDDGSVDATSQIAGEAGARVLVNAGTRGYIESLKTGFRQAAGDIIVTCDADGEHNPEDIPLLIEPIQTGRADLVFGTRRKVPRISEKLINRLTGLRINLSDSCTGFRALRKDLALKLELKGKCTCGIFALEAGHYGARIDGIPITTVSVDKPRKIAWFHAEQTLCVLGWLLSGQGQRSLNNNKRT